MLSNALGALNTLVDRFRSRRSARSSTDTGWTPQLLRQLEWRRFQELCGAYFDAARFERAGMLVQCLPWDAYGVGIKPVRELRSAMISQGVGKGLLVTSGKFTTQARDFAAKEQIRLIDGAELLAGMAALPPETSRALLEFATQGDYSTPTCPSCALKMVPRRSASMGRAFWGCPNYPRCKETVASSA